MKKNNVKRGMLPYLLLILVVLGLYYLVGAMNQKVNTLTYDAFTRSRLVVSTCRFVPWRAL